MRADYLAKMFSSMAPDTWVTVADPECGEDMEIVEVVEFNDGTAWLMLPTYDDVGDDDEVIEGECVQTCDHGDVTKVKFDESISEPA